MLTIHTPNGFLHALLQQVKYFLPPQIPVSVQNHFHDARHKRGPKSFGEWVKEVRIAWRHLDSEELLAESWLASLPPVQNLAASEYGGRSIDKGVVLQQFLKKALAEAQSLEVDEKTHALFVKYPKDNITAIAGQFGLSREHFSREYVSKAARLLTKILQRVMNTVGGGPNRW